MVEVTGNPDAGALHCFEAISAGKHVVNVTVEADVLVGPMLKQLADQAGLIYSLVHGDQPAVIEELYDWAISLGFEVVAAGKGRSLEAMEVAQFTAASSQLARPSSSASCQSGSVQGAL